MTNFIDSHAHVLDKAFDADRGAVLEKTFSSGVKNIIEIACDVDEWRPALELAANYDGKIFVAAGLHPSMAANFSAAAAADLQKILAHEKVLAVGEIGLDYVHMSAAAEREQEVFSQMLALANEVKKTIVIHARKNAEPADFCVYEHLFKILKSDWKPTARGGVMHCFSGRYEDAVRALDTGLKLGVNGIITYKKNNDLRETVKKAGVKNILLETDCPYLPPQTKRGQRNDPSNIPEIAKFTADFLNMRVEELAEITTENCRQIFGVKF